MQAKPSSDTGHRVRGARELLQLRPGVVVFHNDRTHKVDALIDFDKAVCVDVEHGRRAVIPIADLRIPQNSDEHLQADIAGIDAQTWARAQRRFDALAPLLQRGGRSAVVARAKEVGVSTATLYRWLGEYQGQHTTAALIPKTRGWRSGRGRLDPSVEMVIDETIQKFYLTPQRLQISRIARQVALECRRRNLPPPHYNAVSRRIHALPEELRLRARGARDLAERKYRPVPGHFPEANGPLAVVQIDHTPLDVVVVDDEHREPIGRPWLTLAVDVFSRVITGYYLSLDAPAEASVGLCIARSIGPKEALLTELGLDAQWPVWGIMRKIHVDNGPDFRSGTLRRSCELYGINLEFRPVKTPRFGGHIERLLGTLSRELHTLPGTTFSSVQHRGEYRSDRNAALTLAELEKWLVTYICRVYHQKRHSALGCSPAKQWEAGIFGHTGKGGCGLPARPTDPLRVMLDFMPAFERHIRPIGVTIDGMTYYHETLRSWVGATNVRDSEKRKFIFRRDPRDISRVWFFDPDSKDYYDIPYANRQLPPMSLFEYRQARETARKRDMATTNDHEIALALEALRKDADEASSKTKSARRAKQKRRQNERRTTTLRTSVPQATVSEARSTAFVPAVEPETLLDVVQPFEEVF